MSVPISNVTFNVYEPSSALGVTLRLSEGRVSVGDQVSGQQLHLAGALMFAIVVAATW